MKSTYNLKRRSLAVVVASITLVSAFLPRAVYAGIVGEMCNSVSLRLVASQRSSGAWMGEEGFTGSITAGLIRAYEERGDISCLSAAERGVLYILDVAGGNFFGDEAYALARLTDATGEPAYADVVREFYNSLDTAEYISGFDQTDLSNTVFYLAYHTVAAHKVGAADAEMWRMDLIKRLSRIDDDLAYYPVMSLGIATWALAQTGPMDDTLVDQDGMGEDCWSDVRLRDLPGILVTHQAASGHLYAGSFYYRFDHMPADELGSKNCGYTEDTVFGLLGLIAANGVVTAENTAWDFSKEIQNAIEALADGIPSSGIVYNHIWSHEPLSDRCVFAGEVLETTSIEVSP